MSARGLDGPCQHCGLGYPAWYAPNDVWNRAMGGPEDQDDPGGMLCPTCFTIHAGADRLWFVTLGTPRGTPNPEVTQ